MWGKKRTRKGNEESKGGRLKKGREIIQREERTVTRAKHGRAGLLSSSYLYKSNQIKSSQIKSNQIKSNQIKSNHAYVCTYISSSFCFFSFLVILSFSFLFLALLTNSSLNAFHASAVTKPLISNSTNNTWQ